MTISRNKTTAIAIALFLVLTVAVTMVALPTVNAHTPAWTIPTWSYISLVNDVIGVNQETVVVYWTNAIPPTANGGYGDAWTFTIDVTTPDGSTDTLGPFTTDPVGGGWTGYTPTQVGTHTLVAKMAEHKVTGLPIPPGYTINTISGAAYVNDTYSASTSDPVTLTVQEEPIQSWSETPLPTEYWTRPIISVNRNWYVLAGNWLAGSAQNVGPTTRFSYGTGPESAHVMWTSPMWAGGIMDARFGDIGYATGHYEGTDFVPPIILNGKVYYNVQSLPRMGWYCLDLYTGEVEYFHNTTGSVTGIGGGFDASGAISGESLAFGQIYNYASPNQHGGMPYLWSKSGGTPQTVMGPFGPQTGYAQWMMFDAHTGNYICSLKNIPSWVSYGSSFFFGANPNVYGKDGSILSYNIANYGTPAAPNYYLQCWNTSRAIWYEPLFTSNTYWMWRPTQNVTFDGNNGYSLNASIPAVQGTMRAIREDQYIIGGTSGKNNGTYVQQGNLWALNLKPDSNGIITPSLLWNITYTPPQTIVPDIVTAGSFFGGGGISGPTVDPEDGVFFFGEAITRRWWGFSLETGKMLWGPTEPEPQMNFYGLYPNIYQGKLLSPGWGGKLIAYDIKTGEVLWNYTAKQEGFESPYGDYPINICAIADGKIYLVSGEHSISQPMWRAYLRCVNASNGAELWKILQFGADGGASLGGMYVVMADGYVVGLNQYDSNIYCYGKGPSTTTVEAPLNGITLGSSLVIQGTVIDVSAGTEQFQQSSRFPHGVPAMSDADQGAWMEYVYMQQAFPDCVGVPVKIDVIDENGNYRNVATATSDASGVYSYAWKPDIPGKYTVIATFEGSAAYYASWAETAFVVDEAPPATEPPAYPQPIDNTLIIVGMGIAIIIVVAIVGILLLRKK